MSMSRPPVPTKGQQQWGDPLNAVLADLQSTADTHEGELSGRLSDATLNTTIATYVSQHVSSGGGGTSSVSSASITDATTVGRELLTAVDGPTAREAIGAGDGTVKVANITDASVLGRSIAQAPDQNTARGALGIGETPVGGNTVTISGPSAATAARVNYDGSAIPDGFVVIWISPTPPTNAILTGPNPDMWFTSNLNSSTSTTS